MTELINGLYREGESIQDTKAPGGPIEQRWTKRKFCLLYTSRCV